MAKQLSRNLATIALTVLLTAGCGTSDSLHLGGANSPGELAENPTNSSNPSGESGGGAASPATMIIDHTCTDLSKIPDVWIEAAKDLTFHYARTSHGSQVTSGLSWLSSRNSKYNFVRNRAFLEGLPPVQTPAALRLYEGNNIPDTDYITPERYWSTETGINYTCSVADTGNYDFSMWSWCGQQSSNTVETVQEYLTTFDDFELRYPAMRFILMTGHVDGGSATLARNNQMVRDHALLNNKVVYDFADIESYDPDGNHHPNTTQACEWCDDWCNTHPGECPDLPQCSHTHGFNCVQKAKAFWWMMARLAGWPGPSS